MKKIKILFVLVFLIGSVFPLSGEPENRFGISIQPQGTIPLGSSSELFKFGFGGEASVSFTPAFLQLFGVQAGVSLTNLPLSSSNSINVLQVFGGPLFRYSFNNRLSIYASAKAGYYHWSPLDWDAGESNGGGFGTGGNAGVMFRVAGPFTLAAGAAYEYLAELYNGLSISLTARLDFPGLEDEKIDIELEEIKTIPLFPVLYSYYAHNPIGTIKIINTGKKTQENLRVSFFLERYMDNPMEIGEPIELAAGEEREIELYALFTEDLMNITEGTTASALVSVSKTVGDKEISRDFTGVIEFYNRNALSWNDDRRIASFITAKDPEVMNFSKNIMTWMKTAQNPAVDENLQKAMAVFEALKEYGISYEIDPATPFSEFSEESEAIDYLQFPRQTLQYTNGDCDDLTTLYCTLLEAVGVETAFITVPGHIFSALALKTTPAEAPKAFLKTEDLIITDDKVWLPVEITMFQESFERAWSYGAKEWRQNEAEELSRLYPVREAWNTFQAVGFRESAGIELPDRLNVTTAFMDCINRHVEREIQPQLERIRAKINEGGRSQKIWRNKLGVVYARYGLYDDAEREFQKTLDQEEYVPALNNTGGIYFLQRKYEKALEFYNRAIDKDSDNKAALLGVARCCHELENYYMVKKTYAQLQELDAGIAEKFAYLDMQGAEATRAAAAAEMGNEILWEEEE